MDKLIKEFSGIKDAIAKIQQNGFFKSLRSIVEEIVKFVENLKNEFKGDDKKKIALDLIEEIYKNLGINIPILPQWLEIKILRVIAGHLIDKIVGEFNEKGIFNK